LKTITDFSGRKVDFKYDTDTGDLKEVDFMGRVKKYTYYANSDIKLAHNLEKIIDPRGAATNSPVLTVLYNSGDEVMELDYVELTQNVVFSTGSPSASLTDARGHVKSFNLLNDHPQAVTSGGHTTYFECNDDGLVTKITYPMGNITQYTYDSDNWSRRSQANLLSVESSGNDGSITTSYVYENQYNQVTKIIDPKQNETIMTHDAYGNVKTVKLPDIQDTYNYDYYPSTNQLKSVTDPEGNVTEYIYYPESAPSGDGTQTLNARELDQNTGGYLQMVVIDKGTSENEINITNAYVYNLLGHMLQHLDGKGVLTTYGYDNPFGEPTTVVQGATGADDAPAVNLVNTFQYDDNGNVKQTISRGITTEYEYDRLNRLRFKRFKGGQLIQGFEFQYDNNSNLVKSIDPKSYEVSYTYDVRDLLETVTSGMGADTSSVQYVYNDNGQIYQFTDGENHTYTYTHDSHGRFKEVLDPLGKKVTYGYDANSNLISVEEMGIDSKLMTQEFDYDAANRMTHRKIAKEGDYIVTEIGYDQSGQVTSIMPPNQVAAGTGKTWQITPTGAGLPRQVIDPMGNMTKNIYDKRGWVKQVEETEAGGRQLTHNLTHNVMGATKESGDTIGRNYHYNYDPLKQYLEQVIDPENGLVEYEYDELNRLKEVKRHISFKGDGKIAITRFNYDLNNNLEEIIDDDLNITKYEYDSKNRLRKIYYPLAAGTVEFTYNNNGQVLTYTDLNGTGVSYTYDTAGRVTRKDITLGQDIEGVSYEAFEYDSLGRVWKAKNNDSEVEFEYNREGRVSREYQRLKETVGEQENIIATYQVEYGYDDNGNVTSLTYPSGKVLEITPDDLDRISDIQSGGQSLVNYTYEGVAKVVEKNMRNAAVTMSSSYDDGRRPQTLTYTGADNETFFNKEMDWNKVNMKKHDKENNVGEIYEYDPGHRLRKITDTKENTEKEFVIDGNENVDQVIETKQGVPGTTDYSYNERHQLLGSGVSHDANGNMKTLDGAEYVYNWKNQLVRATTGTGATAEYRYDALGRRIEKVVTVPNNTVLRRYALSGHRVIEERDENDTIQARYTYGNNIDEPVEIERDVDNDGTLESYIPMQNTNGSVIGIASSSGNLLEKVKYSTYGRPTFVYDNVNPHVDQVRIVSGDVYIRFSEKVDQTKAESAVKIKQGVDELSGSFTFDENDRRAIFIPSSALPQSVTLTVVATTALEDTFGNTLETEFSQDFTYTGSDLLVYDRVSPEVEVVNLVNDEFIVEFDEEIDATSITGSIDLTYSSGTITGTVTQVDDKTLKFDPGSTLSDSVNYTINVNTTLTDLSGKNLNDTFSEDFVHTDNDLLIYEKPAPSEHQESVIANTVLFHGRNYEPETGLYYFRARYYHPKLGRFLQTDPMGYEDSMNLYQAFNMNSVNFVDPFGEYSYKDFLVSKVADMKSRGYTEEEIDSFVNRGTFKRGYRQKVDRWIDFQIEEAFKPEDDGEYNAWGRKVALWFQEKASVAKSFWASQDSVITHTIGASVSDFVGGAGQTFNLGTKSGEAIIEYQRYKDFESVVNMAVSIWGEASEAYLTVVGGVKGYRSMKSGPKGPAVTQTENMVKKKPIVIGENIERVEEYARKHGYDYYKPWQNKTVDFDTLMKRNRRRVKDWKREGREIIDIGPDFERRIDRGKKASPNYNMERMELKNYEKYKKAFKRKSKNSGHVID
jgi:RHS repeat-associated protein